MTNKEKQPDQSKQQKIKTAKKSLFNPWASWVKEEIRHYNKEPITDNIKDDILKNLNDLAKHVQKIFMFYIVFVFFALIAVCEASDSGLIGAFAGKIQVPIIDVKMLHIKYKHKI